MWPLEHLDLLVASNHTDRATLAATKVSNRMYPAAQGHSWQKELPDEIEIDSTPLYSQIELHEFPPMGADCFLETLTKKLLKDGLTRISLAYYSPKKKLSNSFLYHAKIT